MLKEKDNFSDLEKSQMAKISELQDKIKLMEFDRSQDNITIKDLKAILRSKKKGINEMIKEIEKMQRKNNFDDISHVIQILGIIARQGIIDE